MLASRRLKKNISDNFNAISIDRFSSKTKIGKNSWYFSNSFLCKSDLSSPTKGLFSSLKSQKNNSSSTSDWWEYTKSLLKKFLEIFLTFHNTREHQNLQTKKEVKNPLRKRKFHARN